MAVDWLADGRLDVSRALAEARFSTGLHRSTPQSVPEINVRWVPGLDKDRRRALEETFGLEPRNEVAPTTWSYALTDVSRENIATLVQHPDVEDTHGIDRAEALLVERYQAPSLERVPRLYTLALTFTGVAAGDLHPEDIDLVFVNTVTGQEVEARRVASHDVGDTPSWGPTDRASVRHLPSRRGWRPTRTLISVRPNPANCGCAVARIAFPNISSCPVGSTLASNPAPNSNSAPVSLCSCVAVCTSAGPRTSR